MRISTRGNFLFGFIAVLFTISFYFQPSAQAKEAFSVTFDSQQQTVRQLNQTTQKALDLQTEIQQNTTENVSSEMSGSAENLSESRSFRATAYCLQGRTATGGGVRRGIVAADPRILPLGTRIQVSAGSYSGTYTVADTGGAIRGKILDIWVPTCSEAVRFGRKTISVSVVGGKKSKSNS